MTREIQRLRDYHPSASLIVLVKTGHDTRCSQRRLAEREEQMTREPQSNPAHGGNSFEKEFDPLSETLNLPVNQDDTATEIELAAVPVAGERNFNRDPHAVLRRVTVTLSEEPWLASRAAPNRPTANSTNCRC